MSDGLARYRASGRTSIRFLFTVPVAAAVASGGGWVYQAITSDQWLGLNLLPFAAFAAVIAGLVVAAGRLGHNRNRTLGALAAVAIAGAGLAAAYVFDHRGAAAAAEPATLTFGQWVDARVEHGWTFMGREPGQDGTLTGAFVWLAWVLEALVLGVVALIAGVAFPPFCERCHRWMAVEPLFSRGGLDDAAVARKANATTVDELLALPPPAPAPLDSWELTYSAHRCPDGHGDAYVTVVARRTVGRERSRRTQSRTVRAQVAVPSERLRRPPASSVAPG